MDHGIKNWTATNNTVPMHLVMLPNESLSSGVNFMIDNTAGQLPGLEELKDTSPKSGVEYEAHSDSSDLCQPKYFVFNSRVRVILYNLSLSVCTTAKLLPVKSQRYSSDHSY